jgi:cobalt-precorrin 5A hydrolase/cobalt-precorrin 5A hydrolase/precorrin-3B C17-methyltransferase
MTWPGNGAEMSRGNAETRGVAAGGAETSRAARLVVGAGCSLQCPAGELAALVDAALAPLDGTVVAVATVDRRGEEPAVIALARGFGVPLRTYAADVLAEVDVPTPSATVHAHVGTPSVAEAAALLATDGELVVLKRRSAHATCAIAKER